LRVTPAIESGVSDHVGKSSEIVALLDSEVVASSAVLAFLKRRWILLSCVLLEHF
jgi:hypothetical protein